MSDEASHLALERRHVERGKELVAKQEAILEVLRIHHPSMVARAEEVLAALRQSLQLAQERLADLERQSTERPRRD